MSTYFLDLKKEQVNTPRTVYTLVNLHQWSCWEIAFLCLKYNINLFFQHAYKNCKSGTKHESIVWGNDRKEGCILSTKNTITGWLWVLV